MKQQSAVTIAAHVRPGETAALGELLASMGDGVANGSVLDLGTLSEVHFARLFLLEETTDLEGTAMPASLVYLADFDVARDQHLAELAAAPGLDEVFGHCDGYSADDRLGFLRAHVTKEQARYVNTPGRGVEQIRREAELREALETFLDERGDYLEGVDPAAIRAEIVHYVRDEPSLAWALEPEPRPSFGWSVREGAHLMAIPIGVLLITPLLILGAPVYAILLRRHERADKAEDLLPDEETVRTLAALEDHVVQNPFTAIGFVKPGRFRRMTILGMLNGVAFAARHVFNRGSLAGVKTIHFARWVFLDEGRRVLLREQLRRQPRELHGRLHRQDLVGPEHRLHQRLRLPEDALARARRLRATSSRSSTTCAGTRCRRSVWYSAYPAADRGERRAERADPERAPG